MDNLFKVGLSCGILLVLGGSLFINGFTIGYHYGLKGGNK